METDIAIADRLGARFREALVFAAQLHCTQVRKGTRTPYVAHLLAVAALVIEDGGDEDEAIAALLHDAVEDQGGAATRQRIAALFGERVAAIVSECSDTDVVPKPPWRERKQRYLAHLRQGSASAIRVSLADKVHNARSIVADLRRVGDAIWSRFTATREECLWYYDSLLEVFRQASPSPLVGELAAQVADMVKLARE